MLDALKKGLSALVVLSVVSCGGGGGDGNYLMGVMNTTTAGDNASTDTADSDNTLDSSTDSTADSRIADLEIAVSSRELGSDGSDPVIIYAVVKDKNNNVLKDVDVQFAVDGGGTIEPDEGNLTSATAEDGTAVTNGGKAVKTAKLSPGYSPENRTLTVTVTAGDQSHTLDVDVVGTKISLIGTENILTNSSAEYVVKLTNSGNEPLSHRVVNISSANGNSITAKTDNGMATDGQGSVVFELGALNTGKDTLVVSALGAVATHDIVVSGNDFTLESDNQEINLNSKEIVSLIWTIDGVAQANKVIQLSSTRGVVPGSVITDASGQASFSLHSSTAGGVVVSAIEESSGMSAVLVREFVAVMPRFLTAQSEETNISPEGQATILAIVRDAEYNPVKNQIVRFNIAYDTVNGKLSSSSATTDSLGRASVVYTAGNASSARDGVEIGVSLQNDSSISDKVKLTVGDRAVQIVLGHDEKLSEEGVYYKQTFGVIVTDSAGNPVANKSVDFTLRPIGYFKGVMECREDHPILANPPWTRPEVTVYCASEDTNDNAYLDENEDFNGNGRLDPTHPATITNKMAITDSEGKANVEVVYAQSQAGWSRLRLSASASVEGTEYVESLEFVLSALADDVDHCFTEAAPNVVSPYGTSSSCASPH